MMEQAWRWFGPNDVVTLPMICQAGATGIVTALHDVPYGQVWEPDAILARRRLIEADPALGLRWSVVESLPVHEAIRRGDRDLEPMFDAYRRSLLNLGAAGLGLVCYNFMPLLDWTRTELAYPLPGGATALRFNAHQYVAFDCLMLRRPGAEAGVPPELLSRAADWLRDASESDQARLLRSIMAGLPGAFDRYDIPGLRRMLDTYGDLSADGLRANLQRFLAAVLPAAEEAGIRMCIHPDDPPRPLFGLPRVVSTEGDLAAVLAMHPSPANGITFCTGSLGAGPMNDVAGMARRFARHSHFAHLRNVSKEPDGSFMEADHLGGDVDMVAVMQALLDEQVRREDAGEAGGRIVFRPDHGHELLDDVGRNAFPGYPAIGRLRGLAELRGVMAALAGRRG